MKRLLFLSLLMLVWAVCAQSQVTSQRVHPTTLNPPTSCIPSHFYTNASVGKSWLGKSDNSCEPVNSGGTPVDGTGTANQVSKFTAAQTLRNSGITDDGTTDTFKLTETTPVAPSAALVVTGTGNCTAGAHLFKVTVVTAGGETAASSASGSVTCDGTHKQVTVTIPVGSAIATGRNIYATKAAGSTYFLITTGPVVADNTTVTYTFNIADASFTATTAPSISTAVDARLTVGQSTVTVAKNLTVGGTCTGCGVSNSAGANVIPKSNGTNLVASQISDDGTTVTFGANVATITNNQIDLNVGGTAELSLNSTNGISKLGDPGGAGNGTTLTVDDGAGTVTVSAPQGLLSNNTPLGNNSTGAFLSLYIGSGAPSQSSQITGTFTGNRVATLPDATGTIQLVGAANTGSILPVDMSNGVLSTATGTVYASPGTTAGLTNATESAVSFPITRAGTVRNLYVRTGGTAKVNTPTTTIVVRKNGVDTTLTLVMTQTTSTTSSDTTHSFTVVAGDLITLSFTTTGTAGVSTSIAGVSLEID